MEIGQVLSSKNTGDFEVIRYGGSRDVSVRFLETGYEVHGAQKGNVLRGNVRDLYYPTVQGVGVVGEVQRSNLKAMKVWRSMLDRCYSDKYHRARPTYRYAEVCEEWQYFPNFLEWFEVNYVEGYVLDKDCVDLRRKYYSPETCNFIPESLNTLLSLLREDLTNITPRRTKGSKEYNGLWSVNVFGVYLGRCGDKGSASELAEEFRAFYLEERLLKYIADGEISKTLYDKIILNLLRNNFLT